MGDVAILDVACNRVNEDGSVGERIMSGEQKGSFHCPKTKFEFLSCLNCQQC